MNVIGDELKIFFMAWAVMMLGLLIGFHVNQTLGIVIGFICIPIAGYAVIKGQKKVFKHWKTKELFGKPSAPDDSNEELKK